MIYCNGIQITKNKFPDGTQHLLLPWDLALSEHSPWNLVPEKDVTDVSVAWFYEHDDEMMQLICIVRQLQENGAANIDLFLPYIPNARMDRTKQENEVFTLKYFCEVINSLHCRRVYVLDPHSSVSTALLNRVCCSDIRGLILTAYYHITETMKWIDAVSETPNDLVAFFPDEGAMKRYSSMTNLRYAFGVKRRNWETGEIDGLDVVGDVDCIKGKDVLMVDDICSRGGTFYHSAKKLKELGAQNIYIYCTHCERTVFDGDLIKSGLIKRIYTTDSIFGFAAQQEAKDKNLGYMFHVMELPRK